MLSLDKPGYKNANTQKSYRLYIVGNNEVIGLEEIVENSEVRRQTVICHSSEATVYQISRTNFIDCVNQYRFSDEVLHE
jgi:hypothetical protein